MNDTKGYYAKYKVERNDGQPFIDQPDQFMVMCFARDKHAAIAVLNYADSIRGENPGFAEDLVRAVYQYWCVEATSDGVNLNFIVTPKN